MIFSVGVIATLFAVVYAVPAIQQTRNDVELLPEQALSCDQDSECRVAFAGSCDDLCYGSTLEYTDSFEDERWQAVSREWCEEQHEARLAEHGDDVTCFQGYILSPGDMTGLSLHCVDNTCVKEVNRTWWNRVKSRLRMMGVLDRW